MSPVDAALLLLVVALVLVLAHQDGAHQRERSALLEQGRQAANRMFDHWTADRKTWDQERGELLNRIQHPHLPDGKRPEPTKRPLWSDEREAEIDRKRGT